MKKASHPRAIEFHQVIQTVGLPHEVLEFEQSTRSAQDAADAIGCELGQIVKSLIFKGRKSGKAILVLTSGSNRVDEKKVRALVGEKLGKADADFVREWTGYSIGGVPPFGHAQPAEIFMDEDFFQYETLWAAAGTPNAVFPIRPKELEKVSGAERAKVKIEANNA